MDWDKNNNMDMAMWRAVVLESEKMQTWTMWKPMVGVAAFRRVVSHREKRNMYTGIARKVH
jgi:hypothetical protein